MKSVQSEYFPLLPPLWRCTARESPERFHWEWTRVFPSLGLDRWSTRYIQLECPRLARYCSSKWCRPLKYLSTVRPALPRPHKPVPFCTMWLALRLTSDSPNRFSRWIPVHFFLPHFSSSQVFLLSFNITVPWYQLGQLRRRFDDRSPVPHSVFREFVMISIFLVPSPGQSSTVASFFCNYAHASAVFDHLKDVEMQKSHRIGWNTNIIPRNFFLPILTFCIMIMHGGIQVKT